MSKNIVSMRKKNIFAIDPACHERFFPIDIPALDGLRDKQIGFSGISQLKKGYEIIRRSSQVHQLLYTLGGSGWIRIGDELHYTRPGQIWICPAVELQHYGLHAKQWEIMWFSLQPGNEWSAVEACGNTLREARSISALKTAASAILDEAKTDRPDAARAIDLNAHLIALHLQRELEMEGDSQGKQILDKLNHLFNRVEETPSHNWSVDELLKHSKLHVCPVHFNRLCQEHLGQPPMQIVKKKRLERTKDLLVHTDYSLENISGLVNYQSSFSLSKAFKKQFGVSPAQYRKAHK